MPSKKKIEKKQQAQEDRLKRGGQGWNHQCQASLCGRFFNCSSNSCTCLKINKDNYDHVFCSEECKHDFDLQFNGIKKSNKQLKKQDKELYG